MGLGRYDLFRGKRTLIIPLLVERRIVPVRQTDDFSPFLAVQA